MNSIPTAEEMEQSGEYESYQQMMIAFAKAHVKAALEAAAEQAKAKENPQDYGSGEIWIDKKSILNAYPENKIV